MEHVETSLGLYEVKKLFRLVREHKLLTKMGSGRFGLGGYSISFREYNVRFLAAINGENLPGYNGNSLEERRKSEQIAWELFSAFTHSDWNKEALESFKDTILFPKPRERSHYDY